MFKFQFNKTTRTITLLVLLITSISFLAILAYYFYPKEQTASVKVSPAHAILSVTYDPQKWTAGVGEGQDAFGYYGSGIWLKSIKQYTDDTGNTNPVYEITFDFEKNINAYIPNLKPGDEGWTGADNTKPEKPLPFKKDDFEYVTTVNGNGLYIAKDGNFMDRYISSKDSFVRVSMKMRDYDAGSVLEKYPNNTLSDYLDIFSNYNDVFNGQEQFRIVYIINDPSGSWQELKPELIKILKSMKVEKIK